jgi:hypothetical protein
VDIKCQIHILEHYDKEIHKWEHLEVQKTHIQNLNQKKHTWRRLENASFILIATTKGKFGCICFHTLYMHTSYNSCSKHDTTKSHLIANLKNINFQKPLNIHYIFMLSYFVNPWLRLQMEKFPWSSDLEANIILSYSFWLLFFSFMELQPSFGFGFFFL